METQQKQLEARLEREGWRVVDRDPGPDWWADEIWTVESAWRPVGFRLWVSFLVDPMHSGPRRKGEGVWAVSVTSKRPRDSGDTVSATFTLRGHWSQSLDGLAGIARGLREAVANDGAG